MKVFIAGILLFLFFMYAMTGFTPVLVYQALTKGHCDLSKEIASINFVGNRIKVPSKSVGYCYAWSLTRFMDYDPATLDLYVSLPDMEALDFKQLDRRAIQDNEIRIYIEGHRPSLDSSDPKANEPLNKLKFSQYRHYDNFPVYDLVGSLDNGLTHYKSIYRQEEDTYVAYNEDEQPEFVIECGKQDRICECSSQFEYLNHNMKFLYCFNRAELDDVYVLDMNVNKYLQEIMTPDVK